MDTDPRASEIAGNATAVHRRPSDEQMGEKPLCHTGDAKDIGKNVCVR